MTEIINKEGFDIKVNGIEIVAPHRILIALRILELAKEFAAIPGNPEDYLLQGDKGPYGLDDEVDLKEDNVFITILDSSTQVAYSQPYV